MRRPRPSWAREFRVSAREHALRRTVRQTRVDTVLQPRAAHRHRRAFIQRLNAVLGDAVRHGLRIFLERPCLDLSWPRRRRRLAFRLGRDVCGWRRRPGRRQCKRWRSRSSRRPPARAADPYRRGDGHFFNGNAEPFGRRLRHDRIKAIADLVSGCLDQRAALRKDADTGRRRRHLGRIRGSRASPPDQPIAFALRSRRWIARLPAKRVCSLIEAGHERPAGIR